MRRGFIPTCHPRVGGDPLANNILSKRIDSRLRGSDAFTLIELSIALVIIGLIVGGVLVGQDLIRASELRNTISQKESFNTATNTFRLKYNCLPGDCLNSSSFGLTGAARLDGSGLTSGDGNGQICNINYANTFSNECGNYWWHLSQAGLINDEFIILAGVAKAGVHSPKLPIPSDQSIDSSGWWLLAPNNPILTSGSYTLNTGGKHVFFITQMTTGCNSPGTISAASAYAIDTKIDDGMPLTGSTKAGGYQLCNNGFTAEPTPGTCMSGTNYTNSDSLAVGARCSLLIDSVF